MCGLTGFARHPDAPEYDRALFVFEELMQSIEHRGRHATGVGFVNGESAVYKWAERVSTVVGSEVWSGLIASARKHPVRAAIGHVRHGTVGRNDDDELAHPFRIGGTVGAHNGTLRDWQKLDKKARSDSMAVVAALDRSKGEVGAAKTLEALRGAYALSWAKDGKVYLARNAERPLACAYVGWMRTLFWCSERDILEEVLDRANCRDPEIWEINTGQMYCFTPAKFEAGTSNRRIKDFDAYIPPSTLRKQGGKYQARRAAAKERKDSKAPTLTSRMAILEEQLRRAFARIEGLEDALVDRIAEAEELHAILEAHGLTDGIPPYAFDGQPGLFEEPRVCSACGEMEWAGEPGGELTETGSGALIHAGCIFS